MGFQIGPFYIGGVADAQKKAVLDAAPELPFNFLPGLSEVTKRSPFGFLSGRYAHDAVESKVCHIMRIASRVGDGGCDSEV